PFPRWACWLPGARPASRATQPGTIVDRNTIRPGPWIQRVPASAMGEPTEEAIRLPRWIPVGNPGPIKARMAFREQGCPMTLVPEAPEAWIPWESPGTRIRQRTAFALIPCPEWAYPAKAPEPGA